VRSPRPEHAADWTLAVGPPIVGWRVWRISENDGELVLRSVYQHQVVWPGREPLRADCHCMGVVDSHEAPSLGPGRECGIYAVREEELTRRWSWFTRVPAAATVGKAFGRVNLWGRVIRFAHGYKAEFAYPADLRLLDLDAGYRTGEVSEELAETYGIPVVGLEGLPWQLSA
jgi:hypothetical protein